MLQIGVLAPVATAEDIAVFSSNSALVKRNHRIHFLDKDMAVKRELKLHESMIAPRGILSPDGSHLWVMTRRRSDRVVELAVYDMVTTRELGRIEVGRQPIQAEWQQFWLRISEDGSLLFTLAWENKRWFVKTYSTDTRELVSKTRLVAGQLEMTLLPGDRLLVRKGYRKRRTFLVDPVRGVELWRYTLDVHDQLSITPTGKTLILTSRTQEEIKVRERARWNYFSGWHSTAILLDIATGKVGRELDLGFDPTDPSFSPDNTSGWLMSRDSIRDGGNILWRVTDSGIKQHATFEPFCNPAGVVVSETHNLATLVCDKAIFVHRLDTNRRLFASEIESGRWQGLYDDDASHLYLTGIGRPRSSLYRTQPLEHIASRRVGSDGVRFGLVSANIVGVASALLIGTSRLYINPLSGRTAQLSHDQSHYYVVNEGTFDVTALDAQTFEKRNTVPVGPDFLGMAKLGAAQRMHVFGSRSLLVFGADGVEPALDLDSGWFLGVSESRDRMYYMTNEALDVYRISDLERVHSLPVLNRAYHVLAPDTYSPNRIATERPEMKN
ncbi:MAG: hypothetical protein AAF515_16700 [Pseudomonadota bacterium]